MTIHTKIPKKIDPENLSLKDWDDLPDMKDITNMMPMCSQMMGDHPDKQEVLVVLASFMNQFLAWHKILLGGTANTEEMENIMTGESIVLDMTNDWFRRTKPMLEPVLLECKSCLSMARILKAIGETDPDRLEEEMDLVWYQLVRMWDFIPWFTFMCTGSMITFTSVKLLMTRYCVSAKPNFIEDYRRMRANG